MRLICPNCGAQYEVPDEVIPQGGRDVQCSNCGNTWFQRHPDDDPELAEDLGEPLPDADWSPDADLEAAEPRPEKQPEQPEQPGQSARDARQDAAGYDDDAYDDNAYDDDGDDAGSAPLPPPGPRGRSLDPSVAEVLREEAEREARVRAAESDSFESQPELGLQEPDEDEAARRSREARERMARMRGEAPVSESAAAAAAAAAAGSRRDLLPDIDEINSTLRSSSERREIETPEGLPPAEDTAQSGFGRGFLSVLIVAIIAAAIYIGAPRLSQMLPAAKGPLDDYVATVDTGRTWLTTQVETGLQWLANQGAGAGAGSEEGEGG